MYEVYRSKSNTNSLPRGSPVREVRTCQAMLASRFARDLSEENTHPDQYRINTNIFDDNVLVLDRLRHSQAQCTPDEANSDASQRRMDHQARGTPQRSGLYSSIVGNRRTVCMPLSCLRHILPAIVHASRNVSLVSKIRRKIGRHASLQKEYGVRWA